MLKYILFFLIGCLIADQSMAADPIRMEIKLGPAGAPTHHGVFDVQPVPVAPPPVVCPPDCPPPVCPPDCPPPVCPGDPSCPPSGKQYIPPNLATWQYVSHGLWKLWDQADHTRKGGAWFDTAGVKYGNTPYVTQYLDAASANKAITLNVTELVRDLMADNTGAYLAAREGLGNAPKFWSSEDARGPKLRVTTTTGVYDVPVQYDCALSVTTNQSLCGLNYLQIGDAAHNAAQASNSLITWDFSAVTGVVISAELTLTVQGGIYVHHVLHVYKLSLPELLTDPAAQRPDMVKLGLGVNGWAAVCADGRVLDCLNTTSRVAANADCSEGWVDLNRGGETVEDGIPTLIVTNEGTNATAINCKWHLWNKAQRPKPYSTELADVPKHLFYHYEIWVPPTICQYNYLGTKLPAMEGAQKDYAYYAGMSVSDPDYIPNDWQWGMALDNSEPCTDVPGVGKITGLTPYIYHQDKKFSNPDRGDTWPSEGVFVPGRWYTVDFEHVINTGAYNETGFYVPNHDGVMRLWIDGVLVLERTNVAYCGHQKCGILIADHRIMHGGNGTPRGQNAYRLRRIAMGHQYIGPVR